MHDEPLQDDIRRFLKREMRSYNLEKVDVNIEPDHDGDSSIQIHLTYNMDAKPVDPKALATLVSKLRDHLWERGEHRFPYIHYLFPEKQKVLGAK